MTAGALTRKLLSSTLVLSSAAAALAVLALSGCVDQQHEVAMYRKVVDGPKPPAIPDYTNGMSLQTALLLANRNNEQVSLSGEDYLQSLIDKDRAYSNFLPTISLAPQAVVYQQILRRRERLGRRVGPDVRRQDGSHRCPDQRRVSEFQSLRQPRQSLPFRCHRRRATRRCCWTLCSSRSCWRRHGNGDYAVVGLSRRAIGRRAAQQRPGSG